MSGQEETYTFPKYTGNYVAAQGGGWCRVGGRLTSGWNLNDFYPSGNISGPLDFCLKMKGISLMISRLLLRPEGL